MLDKTSQKTKANKKTEAIGENKIEQEIQDPGCCFALDVTPVIYYA